MTSSNLSTAIRLQVHDLSVRSHKMFLQLNMQMFREANDIHASLKT